jgi:hypothetical protein
MSEIPLAGGYVSGAVRVGDTVRRPASPRSAYVRELLGRFAEAGWLGAPKFLGYDDAGREIVEFIDGDVPAAMTSRSRSSTGTSPHPAAAFTTSHICAGSTSASDPTWRTPRTRPDAYG